MPKKKKTEDFIIIPAKPSSVPAKKGGPKKKVIVFEKEIENYSIDYDLVTEATYYLQTNEKLASKEYIVIRQKQPKCPNVVISLEWKAGHLTKINEIKPMTGRCIDSKITEIPADQLQQFIKDLK